MDTGSGARADTGGTAVRRRSRLARVFSTSAASCVLAAALVAAPVAGFPWSPVGVDSLAADQHTPDVGPGSPVGEGVSVGVVGTTTSNGPTTVQEVLGVLERAELAAKDAGRRLTPQVEQAAAELGMLLSTYLAQEQAASTERPFAAADAEPPAPLVPAPPAHVVPPPVAPDMDTDRDTDMDTGTDEAPVLEVADDVVARPVANRVADLPGPEPKPEPGPSGTPSTGESDDGSDGAGHDAAHDAGRVTFDDVVVAATRLATLLDPATATLPAGILPAGDDGTVAARATLTAGLLQVVEKYGASTAGFANGRIPTSTLCPLDFAPGHMLRCDAAEQLTALSAAYEREFGVPIPMTDSYRTLESQIRLKATKGWLAATPGTSNHGWGLAVDLGLPISTGTSAEYVWMRVHAPDYGWDNPSWARLTGSKPEPWHFEFFAAGPIPDRAWDATDVDGWDGGGSTAAASGDRPQGDKATGDGAKKGDGAKPTDRDASDSGKKGPSKGGKGTGPGTGGTSSGDRDPAPDATEKARVTVPDVTGQSLAAATKRLRGLGFEVATKVQDSSEPKNEVLDTLRAGSKMTKGSTVTLVVSSGPPKVVTVEVPGVAGQDRAAAKQELQSLGLVVTVVEEASTKQPAGVALRTDPRAGTDVAPRSTVTLVVSSGPPPAEQVEIPDVTGWTVADATAELEGLGFVVATEGAVEDDDLIVETQGAGDLVDKGSTVVLTGGAAEPLPDVAGMTVAAAREELEAQGFVAVTAEDVAEDAVVAETDVAAGELVLLGTEVTLVVSTGTGG
jgi:beta-lactam-binding protein with PASTA domain